MNHNSPLEVNLFVLLMCILFLVFLANFRHEIPEAYEVYWRNNYLDLSLAGVVSMIFGMILNIMTFIASTKKFIIHIATLFILIGILLITVGAGYEIYGVNDYN